ncbi:unnamed protein product [Ilex paraguariensis]|uniref:Aminotransferase class V domain-containing protein n=1 Tax=Ilex paraguariensis TaxID=185542 RepID=A0ABC8TUB2_9AQUA
MQSLCIKEASTACFNGCCPASFLTLPGPHGSTPNSTTSATVSQFDFATAAASSLHPNTQFTNHESIPPLSELCCNFNKAFPQYSRTRQADEIRAQDYYHLSLSNHVCLDYIGHGLFSYSQQQGHYSTAAMASSSSSSPPLTQNSNASTVPFFEISYKSANLNSQVLYGGQESKFESVIRKGIMRFMNISEDDYSMVFTANQSSAFKLVADSYPFQSNPNLVTTYDHQSDAVEAIIDTSKKKGARIMSAEFSWPSLRIHSRKLRKMLVSKRNKRKRGLFVFPLQSRITGTRYSHQWMSIARENGWHVLLDASALGAKDMETLGLSLFQPDFLICSFFKVFGENPSGFACLFVKKSSASVLKNSTTSTGIVSIVPASRLYDSLDQSAITNIDTKQQIKFELEKDESDLPLPSSSSSSISGQKSEKSSEKIQEIEQVRLKQKELSFTEIVELDKPQYTTQCERIGTSMSESAEIQCRGLDDADSLGLILISSRVRYLVNWVVNALMSLLHPHSENGFPLVRIYGPKLRIDRGPAVAFNIFDWKGEIVDPTLVQKLAGRNNISLGYEFLHNIWFSDQHGKERERVLERRSIEDGTVGRKRRPERYETGIPVITASLGFLTNFDDMYRLWAFVSRFLDADFVEKEKWRYMGLNRMTVEV